MFDEQNEELSQFRIVYPSGDQRRLSVVEIVPALSYEIDDYSVASSKIFWSEEEAEQHAIELSRKHDLKVDFKRARLLD